MQVFDEVTGTFVQDSDCYEAVVDVVDTQIIYGYVNCLVKGTNVLIYNSFRKRFDTHCCILEKISNKLLYSKRRGMYMIPNGAPEDLILYELYIRGMGDNFPYKFAKRYEAVESFDIFNGNQVVLDKRKEYPLSKYMKYSFGVEFETSEGYVPEDICFRDGLIPLRDGSISGLEYSTVVLQGRDGLALLEQQIESLKKYTYFNKECSLHIHFGGFPLEADKLFNVYYLCKKLEPELENILPTYTFESSKYKNNGKNYCNKLKQYRNFNQMYEYLVGRKFFGDLYQPHPSDIRREAKWRVSTRYFWVNFINALCYNVNKTIEFRFLRPSYNFHKIILWMYIFNAILKFAEEVPFGSSYNCKECLESVIRYAYPEEVSNQVLLGVVRLRILKINQENNNDHIGRDITMEDELFNNTLNI